MAAAAAGQQPPLRPVPRPADYKQRVAQQFDRRAPRYDCDNSYHPPLAARLVQLAALQAGESVLDVATGTGLVALQAAQEVGPTGSVLAIDLSPAMIALVGAQQCAGGRQFGRYQHGRSWGGVEVIRLFGQAQRPAARRATRTGPCRC